MKISVCAVHDKKTGTYDAVFTTRHNGDAIRSWDVIRKDDKTKYGKHPADFDLYQIATFDDQSGQIEPLQPATHLASGV